MHTRCCPRPRPLAVSLARLSSSFAVATALAFASSNPAKAATKTWDNDNLDFLWGTAANWSGDTLPLSTDQIVFGTGTPGTIQLQTARVVDGLTFNVSGFALSDAVQQTLTITSGSVAVNSGVSATINSVIQGTNGLNLTGGGTLILGSANGFSGATSINGGSTLQINDLGGLGTSAATVNAGGTLVTNPTVNGSLNNDIVLNGGTFSHLPSTQLFLGATNAVTINASGGTINVAATGPGGKMLLGFDQLRGSGALTKTGNGTLQLSDVNSSFTGSAIVNGGQVELQNALGLGSTPPTVTVGGTGEFVVSNLTWGGSIVANAGGAISGDNGNSTFSGGITANGQFFARARDFYQTGVGRTLTLSGPITGSGRLIAQGPTTGTGRVLLTGSDTAWTGALQVDPNTQLVATVGFGAGATTSLPSGDLTLNGGRLTITPSIGTGLASTSGIVGRWVNYGTTNINDTFATPWFVNTSATRTDATIDFPTLATVNTTTGLPSTNGLPTGVGIANAGFIDRYGVIYNGLLSITNAGSYTFFIPSDDGSSLFIDGQQVGANEGGHGLPGNGATTQAVTLSSGLHQITLKNTNGGTGGGLQLAYQGPDQPNAPGALNPITNMATVGVPASALSNVTGGLTYTLNNTITVPNQVAATSTTLETTGFDTTSNGAISVGDNGTIVFASGTSNAFTQAGPVTLGANSGLSSVSQTVTVPLSSTLTPADVLVTGSVTLNGNANLNADAVGRLTVNGVINDGAGTFGITKGGAGPVILGGAAANTFDGPFTAAQGLVLLNKPAGVNAIGIGGLNLAANTVGTASIDYAVVRLLASEQIADGATVNVIANATTTGFGTTLDLNNFTETIAGLNITSPTTFMSRVVMGPTGKLVVNGDIVLTNTRNSTGNTGREVLITGVAPASNALNLFAPGTGELSLGGATRNITAQSSVSQLATDGTIDSIITNGGIIKLGTQRLTLNGSNPAAGRDSTFSGGVALNAGILRAGGMGAQTDSALGTGTLTVNSGLTVASGGITAGLATLELRNNTAGVNLLQGGTIGANFVGQSVNNVVTYGNNVTVDGSVPIWGVDVNNYSQLVNGATVSGSGGELRLGTLTTSAPLQLNVTGGNNYSLAFNGISLGAALSVNATTGNLRLNNLSGATNIATIAGSTGNLIIGGNGSSFSGNVSVAAAGTLRLVPAVGVANNLFGTGTFTTAANPTIGISPTLAGGTLTAGTPGGLTAKFYQLPAAGVLNTTAAFASIPSGVTTVGIPSDGAITNRPPIVTGTSFTNGVVVLTGLLNITTGGNYTFQTYVDDESQFLIDGAPLISVNTGGGGTGIIHSPVTAPISLSSGLHTITMKVLNNGGAGGYQIAYNGADSGNIMRVVPATALQSVAPLTNIANSGIDRALAAAETLTLDGGGTDLDGGINNLTFNGAGTVNVTNAGGTGVVTVSGTTSFGANAPTFSPTTGILGLIGDVAGTATITKSGAGTLILAGAKTFTGALNINAGGVQVTNPNSLGTAAGATVVASGAVLDLNGVALGAEPLTLNGAGIASMSPGALWNSSSSAASASGPITVATASTVGGLGDITLSGAITSGNVVLSKVGPGTLTLSGANTGLTGGITVSSGILKIGNADALGTAAGTTTVAGGAVLDLNGISPSVAEPFNITGAGLANFGTMNSLGALVNTGATVTLNGGITLGGAASIGSSSLSAGSDIVINGVISGAQVLTKVGGNTVTLTGASTAPTGVTVNLGTMILNGGGTLTGGTWTINPTATVSLDNASTNVSGRLGARSVNLVGGSLTISGNASAATTEALGANTLTTTSGQSIVTLIPDPNQPLTLSANNALARGSNGTILFRGTGLGGFSAPGVAAVTFGGVPQTVGQFGGFGTKNRAIIPWAIVDPSATGDGTSFAASNGGLLQPLDTLSEYDVDAITGPNNILLTTGTTNAPSGRTLINSITGAGGTLAIGAGNTLELDSGAIGAGNGVISTISGGTVNAGITQSNYLREFVVYTSGATTKLNINSVLASSLPGFNSFNPNISPNIINRSGLTKAGLGTLTLGAQNTYVGTTRLNGGSTVLAGGANTIFYPAAVAPTPSTLVSTIVTQALVLDPGATLDLNGNDQRIGSLASNGTAGSSALPGTYGTITNTSLTPATLRISQAATFTVPSSITQNVNVQRDGGNTIIMTSPNTYSGTTVLNGGLTVLQDGATLANTSSITINRAVLRMDDAQLLKIANRISSSVPITLNGGAINFTGRGGGTQNVYNIGQGTGSVTIGTGAALIQQTMAGGSSSLSGGSSQLNIGNLVRTAPGATVSFGIAQSNNQPVGDNPRFYVSQINGAALPTSVMLPAWITTLGYNPASAAGGTSGSINNITSNTLDFAQNDPVTGIRAITYTSTFAPGNNVNLGANTTLPVGGTVVNSLRLDGAMTLTFASAGADVLNLQSGGLLSSQNNNARVVGTVQNAGRITAGGINPGGPRELYVYNGANTLTINARIIDNPTDNSVISPVFSAANQSATIVLAAANSYSGTTYVNGVNLTLNSTAGPAIPGDLIAGGNTSNGGDSQNPTSQTILLSQSNQFALTSNVTLNGGVLLNLNNQSTTINNLTFGADGGSFGNQGAAVQTGASGTLSVNGNITATNLQQATTIPSMQGNLALAPGVHTVTVGTFPGAPGEIGLALNSSLTGGDLAKAGAGTLGIGGNSSSYTGAVSISSGAIQWTANGAAMPLSTVTIAAGAVLNAGGFSGTVGTLAGTGTVTSTASGIAAVGGQVNVGADDGTFSFGGLVTGVVTIGKVGVGGFTLTNAANNYSGGTLVNGGTLTLAGAGLSTTGSGAVTVNNLGTLAGAGVVPGGILFNSGSAANFALGTPGGVAPISTGTASVSNKGPTTFNFTGTPSAGTYPLIDYAGLPLLTSQLAGIKIGSVPAGSLLFGLVNNSASTSIDLRVETAGAANTWTGAVDGSWNLSASNWANGAFANGQQVTFNDSGVNKVISGVPVNPQKITVNNSATTTYLSKDYSISNSLGGALAGGLIKSGAGSLQLLGANTFGGAISVNGGTLRASVSALANSLGAGSISLANGTTLQLDPIANTETPGITGRYFHQITTSSSVANQDFQPAAVVTQTDPAISFSWTATNPPAGGLVGELQPNSGTANQWQQFGVQWIGKVSLPSAGPWSFFTSSDDGSRVFVDGILVSSEDGGHGGVETGGTVILSEGLHDIRVEMVQTTGGASATLSYQGPGVSKQVVPNTALFTAENVANGQASNEVQAGNNVTVSGTATINLNGTLFTAVQIGGLTTPDGSTLKVTGNSGKVLRAASTFLSGGTVTYDTTADLAVGQITDGGAPTTIVKKGNGRLILDNTKVRSTGNDSNLSSGTVIEVQGGKLMVRGASNGANPLSSAQVNLNGGGLLLDTKTGSVTFDNGITVNQNGTIEVLPNNNTVAGNVVTLGSGTNGVSINGGTLTFDMYGGARGASQAQNQALSTNGAGASLIVAGAINGSGNLVFRSTQYDLEQYPVYGTATLTANNGVFGTTTITGGYAFQGIANPIIVTLNGQGRLSGTTGITLNAAQLNVDDSATVNTGRISASAPVTLRSGTLNVGVSAAAASGETLGTITADAGFNRVIASNTPNVNITGTLTANNLIRNNRSIVQFQGVQMGTAASATSGSGLIKFNDALSGQLKGGGGAAGSATISILPYAFGAANPGTNPPIYFPVTYDATNGVRPISASGETTALASTVANGNARDVITADASITPTANAVNSWVLDNNSNNTTRTATLTTNPLTFSGTGAGLILLASQNATQSALVVSGTAINFNAAEGIIIVTTNNGSGATINSTIQGTNGLTIGGTNNTNVNAVGTTPTIGGNLTLTADNSAGLTGTITINGTLILNSSTSDLPLGNAANPVQFGGGKLTFANSGTTLAGTRTVTLLANSYGVIDTNAGSDTIDSTITGDGALMKVNTGTLTLTNANNNYTGTTTVYQGNLVTNTGPQGNIVLGSAAANTLTFAQSASGNYTGNISGVGSLLINNTGVSAITVTLGDVNDASKGNNTFGGGISFANGTPTTLRGTTSSLVGSIATQAGDDIVYEQNFDGIAGSLISGPAPVTKLGSGKVTFSNKNTYSGVTNVNGGVLSVSAVENLGDASFTNTVAVANGATLQATASFDLGVNRTIALGSGGGKIDVPNVADNLTVSGVISGSTGNHFSKTGFGAVALTAVNTYSGETNVNGGTLSIGSTGSIDSSAGVNVATGARFDVTAVPGGYIVANGKFIANNGNVTGNVFTNGIVRGSGTFDNNLTVNNGGTLAPGNSPGNLTVNGQTTFASGSTFSLELTGGTPGTEYDRLTIASGGGITINGGTLTLSLSFVPSGAQQFTVIDNLTSGPISGVFSNLPNGGVITAFFNSVGYNFVANYSGGTGNDLVLTVPEPTTATIFGAGLVMALGIRRRKAR